MAITLNSHYYLLLILSILSTMRIRDLRIKYISACIPIENVILYSLLDTYTQYSVFSFYCELFLKLILQRNLIFYRRLSGTDRVTLKNYTFGFGSGLQLFGRVMSS